ncbi:MAG TPA: hypothetical protein VFL85_04940 [Candidatus Saccharimonadales bacterium]|nr:hypothetical protein [Candidatus Saccharimonadales bacterium]
MKFNIENDQFIVEAVDAEALKVDEGPYPAAEIVPLMDAAKYILSNGQHLDQQAATALNPHMAMAMKQTAISRQKYAMRVFSLLSNHAKLSEADYQKLTFIANGETLEES